MKSAKASDASLCSGTAVAILKIADLLIDCITPSLCKREVQEIPPLKASIFRCENHVFQVTTVMLGDRDTMPNFQQYMNRQYDLDVIKSPINRPTTLKRNNSYFVKI